MLLTDTVYNQKTVFKAKIIPDDFSHVHVPNSAVTSLNFMTDFDFSLCAFLHSGHLEQMAIESPIVIFNVLI